MSDRVEKLKQYADCWETDMGAWFPGERVVFRGKDLLTELTDLSFLQIIFYAINGKIYKDKQLEFMNSAYTICTSFPDPRLWNNRVASLAGTTRSTGALAVAASTAVSEATVYGRRPDIRASDFIQRALTKVKNGYSLGEVVDTELSTYRNLAGFGRPVTNKDERIVPLLEKAKKANFDGGEHLKLVFSIEEYLNKKRMRLKLNVAGVLTAIMADLGATPKDYYLFCVLCFSAGVFACYLDATKHEEGAFFPFSTETINYKGEANRSW